MRGGQRLCPHSASTRSMLPATLLLRHRYGLLCTRQRSSCSVSLRYENRTPHQQESPEYTVPCAIRSYCRGPDTHQCSVFVTIKVLALTCSQTRSILRRELGRRRALSAFPQGVNSL